MSEEPDRLGDALRELAGGMTKAGTQSCRFSITDGPTSTRFELRVVAVTVVEKKRPKRVGGVLVVYPKKHRGT